MKRPFALISLLVHLSSIRQTSEIHVSLGRFNDLQNDGEYTMEAEEAETTYHTPVTLVPRYLQLGNQTVDLNMLFRVPQSEDLETTTKRDEVKPTRKQHPLKVETHDHGHGSHKNQLPWAKKIKLHDHDRRHGPHFEDASSENTTVVVQAGHTAHLDCRVSFLRDKTVSWVRQREGQMPLLLTVGSQAYTGDPRFSVQFRYPGNWRLRLTQANKTDEGLYECQLSTHPPSVIKVHLKVDDAPEVTIVDEVGHPLREQYYEAGSTLSLKCVARGTHPLHPPSSGNDEGLLWWLHGGVRPLHRDVVRGGVSVKTKADTTSRSAESVLRLARLTHSDAGNYTCELPRSHSYTVLVHVLNESLAELQQGSSTCSPPSFVAMIAAVVFSTALFYS